MQALYITKINGTETKKVYEPITNIDVVEDYEIELTLMDGKTITLRIDGQHELLIR